MNVDDVFDKYNNMERHKNYALPSIEFEIAQRFLELNLCSNNLQSKILFEIQYYIEEFKKVYAKDIIEFVLKYIK